MKSEELKDKLEVELTLLAKQKEGMVDYLRLKLAQEDWHGVADAAMDIREIVSKSSAINDTLLKIK
jgi:hypothetical protein